MSKITAFFLFLSIMFASFFVIKGPNLNPAYFTRTATEIIHSQPASTFFVESSRPEDLKSAFKNSTLSGRKIRILIVPGHDNEYSGTEFNGLKEADATLEIAEKMYEFLVQDGRFNVMITRNEDGYLPIFSNYFHDSEKDIRSFIQSKKETMNTLVKAGEVKKTDESMIHNKASDVAALRLYGINKWANENTVDLVIHVHLNDYPRRNMRKPGEYSGFSIYIPEQQYSNSRASKEIAKTVSEKLMLIYDESNLPKEDAIVEDQDLIAIGAFNTLDPASLLIEYGYIYEPQFSNSKIRNMVTAELAASTYAGIVNFFDNSAQNILGKYNSTLLPHVWSSPIENGAKSDESTLALQMALIKEGVYPPKKFEMRECPLAGTYGQCTKGALTLFQKKYSLEDSYGVLNKQTREKLNELYGK